MEELSDTSSDTQNAEVFEGPEKKLEVYLGTTASGRNLRQFGKAAWADLLADAACTILSHKSNSECDAYLLSESSLFVFEYRIVLKTCGQTTLLLVLPKLARMADAIGSSVELLQYGHLRYKFPEQQVYPHGSFDQERSYLNECQLGEVYHRVLAPGKGCSWYMLSAEKPLARSSLADVSPLDSPKDGYDILEIAMEGLSLEVCELFSRQQTAAAPAPGSTGVPERDLAAVMTQVSGLGDLLPGVLIDDWAFEPCGYSMNGLRAGFYYTVHVTPEPAFSYASFETNDPRFRDPSYVKRIISIFAPTMVAATLTTRRIGCELPVYSLPSFECTAVEVQELGRSASVCSLNFTRTTDDEMVVQEKKVRDKAASGTKPSIALMKANLACLATDSGVTAGVGQRCDTAATASMVGA